MLLSFNGKLQVIRHDAPWVAAIVAAYVMAAVLVGYAIATGRPTPVALILGAIAGVALLNALPLVVWAVLIGTLLISGPTIMFVPVLSTAEWMFSLMGFFLAGAAVLHAAIGRERAGGTVPGFVVLVVVFMVFGATSIAYSGGPIVEGIRAAKRYFQFYGILFILAVVPFRETIVRRWWAFLLFLAGLQLPFAVYQRILLVPLREGLPNVVPIDIVVGTMEGSLTGGGSSSVMALFLLWMQCFVLAAWRERMIRWRVGVALLSIFAVPLAIGEVNAIVVLLPIALAFLYLDLIRKRPKMLVAAALIAVPILVGAGWLYLATQTHAGQPLEAKLSEILAYNFGEAGYYGRGLNRTSVFTYWARHHNLDDPVSFVFGHGLGSSFGGIAELNPGHMDRAHTGMFIGLTSASAILWDLGLVGLILALAILYMAGRTAYQLTLSAAPGFDRAFCRTLSVMVPLLAVMLFYSDAMIAVPSQETLAAATLGLIAWRWRLGRHVVS